MSKFTYDAVKASMYDKLGGWMIYFILTSLIGMAILAAYIFDGLNNTIDLENTLKLIGFVYNFIICILIIFFIGKKNKRSYKIIKILLLISLNWVWYIVFASSERAAYYFNDVEPPINTDDNPYKRKIVKTVKDKKRCPVCKCYITNPSGKCNACGWTPKEEVVINHANL